jgi:hypothetical protein
MLRVRFAALAASLLLLQPFGALAQQTCATAEGSWNDANAGWSLTSDGNGNYTGLLTNKASAGCPSVLWGVTGRQRTGGDFQFTAVWNTQFTRPVGCVESISYSGHLNQPGCNRASGTWQNSGSNVGAFNATSACRVPTGESTPVFQNWGTGDRETIGQFQQYILPHFNYGGRFVYETFNNDATDTCHFSGSRYAYAFKNNGAPQHLSAGTQASMIDSVGMSPELIRYYRVTANRSPCQYILRQRMKIGCETASADQIYKTNELTMRIEDRDVVVGRGPTFASKSWGPKPPAKWLPTIIDYLLAFPEEP